MKTFNNAFSEALSKEVLTFAWCWRITRLDGVVLGFTSFDLPLTIDGLVYEASGAFDPGAVLSVEGIDRNDTQEVGGFLNSEAISEADLIAKKYDYAKIDCFVVNYLDLPTSLAQTPPKFKYCYNGIFGKITKSDRSFNIEIRTLDALLENKIGTLTSKLCRATFGDSRCTVNLTAFTHSLTVTAVTSRRAFTVSGSLRNGYFDYGLLQFTSGVNGGIKGDIAYYANNQMVLFEEMPYEIEVGNTISAIAGCPKTILACQVFNNVINFQGEPHVPLQDKIFNTPIGK